MIRIEKAEEWWLLEHAEHAALAGEFARHWKNDQFVPAPPFAHVLDAVSRHDDSWRERDAQPELTPEGLPSAFSKELVGSYDAFEEIDLAAYLQVRGQATEQAALRDPYSAILISMHTVNLLTEQADLEGLDAGSLELHRRFVEGQRLRQCELAGRLSAREDLQPFLGEAALRRGFEFLQACDSFSLLVGVDYPEDSALRHRHPTRSGERVTVSYHRVGEDHYVLDPWPLDEAELRFRIPTRRIPKSATASLETFRAAYASALPFFRTILVTPGS
ncbi:MAG: DUF3891 family protein [Kiritimatiellia bacterium]